MFYFCHLHNKNNNFKADMSHGVNIKNDAKQLGNKMTPYL